MQTVGTVVMIGSMLGREYTETVEPKVLVSASFPWIPWQNLHVSWHSSSFPITGDPGHPTGYLCGAGLSDWFRNCIRSDRSHLMLMETSTM